MGLVGIFAFAIGVDMLPMQDYPSVDYDGYPESLDYPSNTNDLNYSDDYAQNLPSHLLMSQQIPVILRPAKNELFDEYSEVEDEQPDFLDDGKQADYTSENEDAADDDVEQVP